MSKKHYSIGVDYGTNSVRAIIVDITDSEEMKTNPMQTSLKLVLSCAFCFALLLSSDLLSAANHIAVGDAHLQLRYEICPDGIAFRATPTNGAAWNATLHGSAFITKINGHGVVDMGSGVNGYVNLGAQIGALLQTLPEFSIEAYVYIPFQNQLKDVAQSGHFVWTFSDTNAVNHNAGRYMFMKASNQVFAISSGGWGSNQQVTNQLASYFNGPLRRGMWEHIVVTRSGNTINLFVGGQLKGTQTTTVAHNSFGNLDFNYLARSVFNGDAYLPGAKYYRVSVYDKAFTQQEIATELGVKEILAGLPNERIMPKNASVPMMRVSLHTPEDFARIREKLAVNEEPWVSGYQRLITNSHTVLTWNGPHPTEFIIRGAATANGRENYMNAARSVAAAYQKALVYRIGHEDNARTYADQAVNILNRWANENKHLDGNSNVSLASGLYGYQFALAGELMRNYDGWDQEDFAKFQQWLLNVFYPANMDFLIRHHNCWDDHYWTNWDMCNIASLMAIAIVCDRRDIYNWALEALQGNYGEPIGPADPNQRRVVGNGYWFKAMNYVHITEDGEELAQQQESGRDQGHTVMNIGLFGVIAQMAWNQGDDLFGLGDNLFLKNSEYVAKYNIVRHDVPFTTHTRFAGNRNSPDRDTMHEISSAGRGHNRPVWALPYYHYTVVEGIAPEKIRWTRFAKEASTPEGGPQMGNTSGAYDSPGFGTLMYTR